MSADPKDCRDNALLCAERAATAGGSDLKAQLTKMSRGFLRASIELERSMALRAGLRESRGASAVQVLRSRLEAADRQVAECQRLVTGWSELADQEQARGKNVTIARDLLETFQANLRAAIRKKEEAEKALAQRLRALFKGAKGRQPHTDQELHEWLASAEGKVATAFEPTPLRPVAERGRRS